MGCGHGVCLLCVFMVFLWCAFVVCCHKDPYATLNVSVPDDADMSEYVYVYEYQYHLSLSSGTGTSTGTIR